MTDFEFARQSGRKLTWRYDALDKDEVWKKTLHTVQSCIINYDSLSTLKASARIKMRDDPDIDFANDRIRVTCIVTCGDVTREYAVGTYLICAPARTVEEYVAVRDIEAYSKLQIYEDDKVENRYILRQGTNIVNEVIRILGTKAYKITASEKTLQTDREWEIGTSKLTIINDLLEVVNYTSLRVSASGVFEADPYILPADRPVDFAYLDDCNSILSPDVTDDIDLFSVPNVFVRYTNDPDAQLLRSIYVNDNPFSPTSTVSRARRITSCEEVQDIADQETLDGITRRDAALASQVYSNVTFGSGIMPLHGYLNTIRLKCGDINGRYQETAWEIPCAAGEQMKHTVRKVVQV